MSNQRALFRQGVDGARSRDVYSHMVMNARQLDRTFAALADPTRRAILSRLALGEASVGQLLAPFPISQPAISKHLKVLERAGLVERGRDAQFRPCRLNAAPLASAAGWLEGYRRFWEMSLDRLDGYVKVMKAEERKRAPRAKQLR
jgi:DNA-binding transcriptional ArsR family regulator